MPRFATVRHVCPDGSTFAGRGVRTVRLIASVTRPGSRVERRRLAGWRSHVQEAPMSAAAHPVGERLQVHIDYETRCGTLRDPGEQGVATHGRLQLVIYCGDIFALESACSSPRDGSDLAGMRLGPGIRFVRDGVSRHRAVFRRL